MRQGGFERAAAGKEVAEVLGAFAGREEHRADGLVAVVEELVDHGRTDGQSLGIEEG